MRLFVTGASGQLGSEVLKRSQFEIYGIYSTTRPKVADVTLIQCDITDRTRLLDTMIRVKPDWVLHLASATKVEWCEANKELAWKINVDGTRNVVDGCRKLRSKLIFVSTDFVFDGNQGHYRESDKPNPINHYGRTKLEAEAIVSLHSHHVIARSCLMYSGKQGTFTSWVLKSLKRGEVSVASDIVTSPTLASEQASCLLFVVEKELQGLYHTAGAEPISKYEFVRRFAEAFGYSPDLAKPVKQEELNLIAPRPRDSSLDISKISSAGFGFSTVDVALKTLRDELEEQH